MATNIPSHQPLPNSDSTSHHKPQDNNAQVNSTIKMYFALPTITLTLLVYLTNFALAVPIAEGN